MPHAGTHCRRLTRELLLLQFARARARNTIIDVLLHYVQHKVEFVADPEGPLKVCAGGMRGCD
jgi:hypothetical protein